MRRRSAPVIELHIAISRLVRPQPIHCPEASSSTQMFTHGLSMAGCAAVLSSNVDIIAPYLRPGSLAMRYLIEPRQTPGTVCRTRRVMQFSGAVDAARAVAEPGRDGVPVRAAARVRRRVVRVDAEA